MARYDSSLEDILTRCWDWAGYDAAAFSADYFTPDDEKEPFYFPELALMRTLCYACENEKVSGAQIADYLTCMALDNEEEEILAHCVKHAPDAFVEKIALASLEHPQWNARWQIAELLRRRDVPARKMVLSELSRDHHSYVRQRAAFSLREID